MQEQVLIQCATVFVFPCFLFERTQIFVNPLFWVTFVRVGGPELYFHAPATIAVCGAPISVTANGTPVDMWKRVHVAADTTLTFGKFGDVGSRVYMAVYGCVRAINIELCCQLAHAHIFARYSTCNRRLWLPHKCDCQ